MDYRSNSASSLLEYLSNLYEYRLEYKACKIAYLQPP